MIEVQSQIDCGGKRYICATENAYLLCFDDPRRNTTVTVADRVSVCPTGTICDTTSDFCDSGKKLCLLFDGKRMLKKLFQLCLLIVE